MYKQTDKLIAENNYYNYNITMQLNRNNSLTDIVVLEAVMYQRAARVILSDINISISRGKITAIMGPSGCGKTTLLRLIGAQLTPEQGRVTVDGYDLATLSRSDLYNLRTRMGMLFQSGALFSDLSVFENVAFPLREHTNLDEAMIRDLVLIKLEAVGLRGAANMMPANLSGGMARRVALARAVALDPSLILYDEPFTGQDPLSMGVLMRLIRSLNDNLGMSTVLVSHDIHETLAIADYVYLLADTRVIGHGTPAEINGSDNPWIRQFIRGEIEGPVPFHYPAPAYGEHLLEREGY
jgi:phospholipid/cholesterol/gamma-HCH transport system ATP-binding protein